MRLLDKVKVTQVELPDRMARRYKAELTFEMWRELDLMSLRRGEGSHHGEMLQDTGLDFACKIYDTFYGEILTRVRDLYYHAMNGAPPAYRDEVRRIADELFTLLKPSREEEDAMICKVAQAPSGRTPQGDSLLKAMMRQQEAQIQQMRAQAAAQGATERALDYYSRFLESEGLGRFSASLFNPVIEEAPAQTPPEEEIQPGHLDDEEDVGDNVIDEVEDEGIAEAQAFVHEFLRDVGGSDEPDPGM